jgi:hypothetical protein
LAHNIANAIKLLLEQITDRATGGKSRFADKYKKTEVDDLQRFAYLNEKTAGRKNRYILI